MIRDGASPWRFVQMATLWCCILTTFGVLAAAAFGGFSVRPIADDWCAAAWVRMWGVLGATDYMYGSVNGRSANGAILALVNSLGLRGLMVLPTLLTLGYVVVLAGLFHATAKRLRAEVSWSVLFMGAGAATVALLLGGTTVYQVYYWAPGSVSHTLPPLICLVAAYIALRPRSNPSGVRWPAIALVVMGAVVATLNEAIILVGGAYGMLASLWLLAQRRHRTMVVLPVAWLFGLTAGALSVLFSPGRRLRQAVPIDQPSLLTPSGMADLASQWVQTTQAVLTQGPYLAVIGAGVVLGLSMSLPRSRSDRTLFFGWLALVVTALLSSWLVIAAVRMGYGPNGWTYERVWMNFLVPWVVTALAGAVLGGAVLRRRLGSGAQLVVLVCAGTVTVLSVAVAALGLVGLTRDMAQRAADWDRQDQRIVKAESRGRAVVSYTPRPLGGLNEPFAYRRYERDWISQCVSRYYGVDRIRPDRDWLNDPASRYFRTGQRP